MLVAAPVTDISNLPHCLLSQDCCRDLKVNPTLRYLISPNKIDSSAEYACSCESSHVKEFPYLKKTSGSAPHLVISCLQLDNRTTSKDVRSIWTLDIQCIGRHVERL